MKSFSLCSLALRSTVPLRIIRLSQLGFRSISRITGQMTSQRNDSIPHELRTAAEPRQNRLYPVRLSHIEQVNPSVRLLQFALPSQENNVWDFFYPSVSFPYVSYFPCLRLMYQARLSNPDVVVPAPLSICPARPMFQSHRGIYHIRSPKKAPLIYCTG